MRYTEKKHVRWLEAGANLIESTVGVVLKAPFILVKEIGMKITFLKRKTIEHVLSVAILIAVADILMESGMRLTTKSFNLYVGSLPLIVRIVGLMVLVAIYFVYELYDFKIYQDIEEVLSVRRADYEAADGKPDLQELAYDLDAEEESIQDEFAGMGYDAQHDATDADEPVQDLNLQEIDFDNLQGLDDLESSDLDEIPECGYGENTLDKTEPTVINLKKDIESSPSSTGSVVGDNSDDAYVIIDDEIADYKQETEQKVNDIQKFGAEYTGDLSDAEIADIEQRLADDSEPLDEALAALLEKSDAELDDFEELENLEDWGIPSYFNMMV